MLKSLISFRIFFSLFFIFCYGQLYAELPQLGRALETKLYQGTTEEIKSFILQRQEKAEQLTQKLKLNLENTEDIKSKEQLKNSLDLLQGLIFLHKSLESELNRIPIKPTFPTTLAEPPYKLGQLDKILNFQRKVEQELISTRDKTSLLQNEISNLKAELIGLSADYLKLKPEEKDSISIYETLGQILNLQTEFAILQLKQPKIKQRQTELKKSEKANQKQLNQILKNLEITEKDLSEAKNQQTKITKKNTQLEKQIASQQLKLSKQKIIYEARLDKARQTLSSNGNNFPFKSKETENKRYELVLEAVKLKQLLLSQTRLKAKLELLKTNFRYEWIESFFKLSKGRKKSRLVKKWILEEKELISKKELLIEELSLLSLQRATLTKRLVTISNELKANTNSDLEIQLRQLESQARKTLDNLDMLSLKLSNNISFINLESDKIKRILLVIKMKMSLISRLQTSGTTQLTNILEKIKDVIYYPLFNFGQTSVTLKTILLIIFWIFIGIVILKLIRAKIESLLVKQAGLTSGTVHSITTLGYYILLMLGLLIVLSSSGLDLSQLSIILGALGVGIGFGLQTIANNFISGIILLTERSIMVGDFVELENNLIGEVLSVSIRSTTVRTFDGKEVIVPNSEFVSSRVNTWTYSDDWRRLEIPFSVSYNSDPAQIVSLAEEAARSVKITAEDDEHPLRIRLESFGSNRINFSIRVWCHMWGQDVYSGIHSDYYFALFKKLKEANIKISLPQLELHLKSISDDLKELLQKSE